jgi:hypothetical protein
VQPSRCFDLPWRAEAVAAAGGTTLQPFNSLPLPEFFVTRPKIFGRNISERLELIPEDEESRKAKQ